MQKQWVEINSVFLDYLGNRFGKNVKESIKAGELVVTNIDTSSLPKFETEEDAKEHVAKLKHWEQDRCTQDKENWNKLSMVAIQRL